MTIVILTFSQTVSSYMYRAMPGPVLHTNKNMQLS